jgi:glycosyltransferase involved in cell wall biosynthesis
MVKVALVSTFPPAACGIGNYSQELVRALPSDVELTVLAEREGSATTPAVRRVWHRKSDWVSEISAAAVDANASVVHIQHEQGILGQDDRLPRLVGLLRDRGIRSVVTLHSVYDTRGARAFHQRLACDRIIVHQQTGMASVLAAQGVPSERVEVIAHGTPALDLPDQAAARELLGLPKDKTIVLFFGFIHTGKKLHVALRAFERIRVPNAYFVIAGHIREDNVFQRIYARWLRRQMRRGIAEHRIEFRSGFQPVEHKPAYYAAADLVVMPHMQAYGSASGVMHEALSARRPIVCTRGKKFAEAVEAFATEIPEAFPPGGDVGAWARALETMLTSPELRAKMSARLGGLAEATSWASSGERHARIYRALTPNQERIAS